MALWCFTTWSLDQKKQFSHLNFWRDSDIMGVSDPNSGWLVVSNMNVQWDVQCEIPNGWVMFNGDI